MISTVPLLLALLLDLLLGDPPNRCHPVVCMGMAIRAAQRRAPEQGRWALLCYGSALVLGGVALTLGFGLLLSRGLYAMPVPLRWIVEACMLKTTFSLRGLVQAATQVQQQLHAGDLARARYLVGWHLVSRDTTQLSTTQVAAATIESVAENASDSLVAPLLYYALGGLPAALAYRFVNTADAMLGYRHGRYAWLGKTSARLDDLVNLVPARLTALLMVLAAPLAGGNIRQARATWRRDARHTASPNAGHPMSTMAGALGVELEKVGHYRLGSGLELPTPDNITGAIRLLYATAALATAVTGGLTGLIRT